MRVAGKGHSARLWQGQRGTGGLTRRMHPAWREHAGLHAASRTPACSLRNSARRPVCTDTKIRRKTPQRHDKAIFLHLSFHNQIEKHLLNKLPETLKNGVQFSEKSINFSYVHSAIKQNLGKIGVLVSLRTTKSKEELKELGKQLAMHIAALSPLAIDKN